MRTEILNEIQFHADAYRDGTINSDDFRQAVDEILDHNFELLLTAAMNKQQLVFKFAEDNPQYPRNSPAMLGCSHGGMGFRVQHVYQNVGNTNHY